MRLSRIGLFVQSAFYIGAGINHFWHRRFYLHIMPDHYSHPEALVQLSGAAELLGGLGLLLPATRRSSAAGIVLMLIVFLDVHQFMLRHSNRYPEIPYWTLWARFPIQLVLIAWALHYARNPSKTPTPAQ